MHESMTLEMVMATMTLLFTASIVAIIAKKVKLPFTILLVIIGLILGYASHKIPALHSLTMFKLTPDVVLFVFLPALIFESAFNLNAKELMRNILPILTLAIPALLISTATVGFIVHYALGLPLGVSLLFGSLISATDPVAVVALFKEIGAPKRLNLLVEGESLFNDATALVVFKIILGVVLLGNFSGMTIANGVVEFFIVFFGGIAMGIILGLLFSITIETVRNDPLVEITLTTILAHTAFIAAEHLFHVSGVMSVVAAGLVMGGYGKNKISPAVQEHMESFWEYFAFVCNSLIFLLVGLSVDIHLFMSNLPAIFVAAAAILIARSGATYSLVPLIGKLKMVEAVDRKFQTVIFWGGLRGALAIAIALSIPEELKERDIILVMTLGVVLFTLLVNGLTINPLMNALGLNNYSMAEKFERLQALLQVKQKAWNDMLAFATEGAISPQAVKVTEAKHEALQEKINLELKHFREGEQSLGLEGEKDMVMRHSLMLERVRYYRLFEQGILRDDNLRDMLHIIDSELDRIKEGREMMGGGEKPHFISAIIDALFNGMGLLYQPFLMRHKTNKIAASYERKRARLLAFYYVIKKLEGMESDKAYSAEAIKETKAFYQRLCERTTSRIETLRGEFPEYVEKVEAGILKRCRLNSELASFHQLYEHGAVTDKVLKAEEEKIDEVLRKMKVRPVESLTFSPAELIAKVPCFAELSPDEQNRLTGKLIALSFLPGETIVNEGDHGDSLFIIGRGQVDILTRDEDGRDAFLAKVKAGEFFGEVALLHPQPRTATVRASTPATLLELSREALMPYLEETPHLKEALEDAYKRRLLNTQLSHLHAFAGLENEEREAIAVRMEFSSFKAGETVSDFVDRLFLIKEGELEVIRKGGKISTLSRGAHFGEDALLEKAPSGDRLIAKSDLEVYSLSRENLDELFKESPGIKDKLK